MFQKKGWVRMEKSEDLLEKVRGININISLGKGKF